MLRRLLPGELRTHTVTTTDVLKIVGLLLVVIDHYGLFFDEDQNWWRVFGRAAAPVFFFLIGFARSRRVPWTWLFLGLLLTAVDTWTDRPSGVHLNILINFAYVRLLLPEIERRVMPSPWRVLLLAIAIILLIRPFQSIMEYGAEGWLWALFGLSHRLALERHNPHSIAMRNVLAAVVFAAYTGKEIIDYDFTTAQGIVLALVIGLLIAGLIAFRRVDLRWEPPQPFARLFRFCGRHSLEIYAITLLLMQISAYAIDWLDNEDGEA